MPMYMPGAEAAAPHWSNKVSRYFEIMRRVVLPPRGRAGSAANKLRARTLQAALHQEAVRGAGKCPRKAKHGKCALCNLRVELLPDLNSFPIPR